MKKPGFLRTASIVIPPAAELAALSPEAERTGKFEFMWNNRDRLYRIKSFVIAVDNDPPGKRLAEELVRRLGEAEDLMGLAVFLASDSSAYVTGQAINVTGGREMH